MRYLTFLLCVVLANAINIKVPSKLGPRIINGNLAKDGQFPWQVGILGTNRQERYFCGGALISDEWVLTAGHCVVGTISAQIYSGSVSLSSGNRTTSIGSEFIVHEKFVFETATNDVGLIKLSKPVTFNANTKAITLSNETLGADVTVTVTGWGQTSDDAAAALPDALRYINVQTVENSLCTIYYGAVVVDDAKVCTDDGNPLVSPCEGDSGGPAVINHDTDPVHVAIFSFVNQFGCELPYPAGYTRTSVFREWIREKTGI